MSSIYYGIRSLISIFVKKHINMEIKVGDYNVLESGSVVCMDGYPIVFTFGKLTYKVIIHRDKGADELGKNVVFNEC